MRFQRDMDVTDRDRSDMMSFRRMDGWKGNVGYTVVSVQLYEIMQSNVVSVQ